MSLALLEITALDELPHALQILWTALAGLMVGSFLNVCIYRLPLEGQSVRSPRRSRCPSCGTELGWRENVPVLSWLVQRGRCRSCGWSIPARYPLVELLTACLFALVAWITPWQEWDLLAVQLVALSGLLVATFVDFDCFEIPDEISIGGMVLGPLAAFAVPALHRSTWIAQELTEGWLPGGEVDRAASLVAALAGMAAGGGILLAIGWLGKRIYGRDAMGLGDVKLLAAGGALIGPGGVLVALMLASIAASCFGLSNMLRFFCLVRARARRRGTRKGFARALASARIAGRYVPFGPFLGIGIGIALLAWNPLMGLVR